MFFKYWRILYLLPVFWFANAQNDLYPELLSKQFFQETEDMGQLSCRLTMGEQLLYRAKAHISRGHFDLYQLSEGDGSGIKHCCSFAYEGKYFSIMRGHGLPHIACGVLLGNTMMGFTADPTTNVGLYKAKCRIQNNFYHKDIVVIRGCYRDLSLSFFRWDDRYVSGINYDHNNINAGTFIYFLDTCTIESYFQYAKKNCRLGIDLSLSEFGVNHLMSDLFYRERKVKLYLSSVYLGKNFKALKSDSKWGSALKAGGYGLSAGISCEKTRVKLRMSATRVYGERVSEDKILVDLSARYKKINMSVACNYRYRAELSNSDDFPYLLQWQYRQQIILKFGIKAKVSKKIKLAVQIQNNVFDVYSYTAFCRVSYVNSRNKLLVQVSQSAGAKSDLYYLRPLSCSSYSIRKAGYNEGMFLDLVYEYQFEKVIIGILIRSEGVQLTMQVK